jgi:CRP-like cAMP-binding protein
MEGELRARTMVDDREVALGTIGVGDFFGEIALLDHGPRSADVIANEDSTVLVISAASIDKIMVESPASAAKFLRALAKYVAGRTRAITKRYEDTIHFSRAAAQVGF